MGNNEPPSAAGGALGSATLGQGRLHENDATHELMIEWIEHLT